MKCNLCGNESFKDLKTRKNIRCEKCHSLERTRLLWMYLENLDLDKKSNILHLAPERGIYKSLVKKVGRKNYVVADLDPERYSFSKDCIKIDLCDLDNQPSSKYDLIIDSHVMEHIPCNIAYTFYHLHRMLKKDGLHICIIPFMAGKYDECFQEIGDDERKRRFGQFNHVRRFGRDDIGKHLGSVLNLPKEFDATNDFTKETLKVANIPEKNWKGFGTSTVLKLKKHDMKLLIHYDHNYIRKFLKWILVFIVSVLPIKKDSHK